MTDGRGHAPGVWIVALIAVCERFFSYSMTAPILMVFLGEHVLAGGGASIGADAAERILESAYGPLDAAGAGARLYGVANVGRNLAILAGGALADRVLGPRRALLLGAALMAGAYAVMAIDGAALLGLPLWVLGAGAFAPSLVAQLDALYGASDARRAPAFLLLYVASNLGIFFSAFAHETLVRGTLGWAALLALASGAMLVSLVVVASGRRHLPGAAREASAPAPRLRWILVLCAIGAATYGAMVVQYVALTRWVDAGLAPRLFGWEAPGTWLLQPASAGLVLLLAPLAAMILRTRRASPATIVAIGCATVAVAALLPVLAIDALERGGASAAWGVASTATLCLGELLIGPLALSLVAALAPRRWVATAAGSWLVARELIAEYPARAVEASRAGLPDEAPLLMAAALACAAALGALALGRAPRRGEGHAS